MTKSTVTTRISAAFLAAVLVAGTIALSSPSFMLGAQAESYYGMDKKHDSYGSSYDSYGKDSSYDKKPYSNDNYGKDSSYDKKPYENTYGNSYGQDYPSYKPVYKKDQYGKDRDYDNSKSSSSVSIKKLKCNNINVNLNNINATFGSPVQPDGADGGATDSALAASADQPVTASGLMNGGNNGDRSYVDRENNFAFVCINNNNNNAGAGNATNNNQTDPCEECFTQNLNSTQFALLAAKLTPQTGLNITIGIGPLATTVTVHSFAQLCALIDANPLAIVDILRQVVVGLGVSPAQFEGIILCIAAELDITIPPTRGIIG